MTKYLSDFDNTFSDINEGKKMTQLFERKYSYIYLYR